MGLVYYNGCRWGGTCVVLYSTFWQREGVCTNRTLNFCCLFDKQAAQALPSCAQTKFTLNETTFVAFLISKLRKHCLHVHQQTSPWTSHPLTRSFLTSRAIRSPLTRSFFTSRATRSPLRSFLSSCATSRKCTALPHPLAGRVHEHQLHRK